MKNTLIVLGIIIIIGFGLYFMIGGSDNTPVTIDQNATSTVSSTTPLVGNKEETVIGKSVQGRDITAYHYGEGSKELLFVGGIHGGYEWNTVLLAYNLMDYLKANPDVIPKNIKVTVIPVLNPDGLNLVVGVPGRFTQTAVPTAKDVLAAGRFNANNVDLSRNFDCDWQAKGVWQTKTVSGGKAPFSEPEAQAFKGYVESSKPTAAVVWYSAAGGVYASNCGTDISAETRAITSAYAQASGYPAQDDFDFYALTGDAVNWLAKENIPAISVLLTTHSDIEWDKNLAGIKALFSRYSN